MVWPRVQKVLGCWDSCVNGGVSWRKMKGIARIEDEAGWVGDAEVHWFEAHGVGRVRWKIKRRLHAD